MRNNQPSQFSMSPTAILAHCERHGLVPPPIGGVIPRDHDTPAPIAPGAGVGAKKPKQRGPRPCGAPNATETRYHLHYLVPRLRSGELACALYEFFTLRLADGVRYTPDWVTLTHEAAARFGPLLDIAESMVLRAPIPAGFLDGFEAHEVKGGHIWDDARVKLKVAASQFPCRFVLGQKTKGQWIVGDVPGLWTRARQQEGAAACG